MARHRLANCSSRSLPGNCLNLAYGAAQAGRELDHDGLHRVRGAKAPEFAELVAPHVALRAMRVVSFQRRLQGSRTVDLSDTYISLGWGLISNAEAGNERYTHHL